MLISCEKDLQTNIEPTQHESTNIDLNDDGETDFRIRYSQVILESYQSTF
jgi:hypothetical protein